MLGPAVAILVGLSLGAEAKWEEKAKTDGVVVYTRNRPGTGVREIKAEGTVDSPPRAVFRVLDDHDNYAKTMPYTDESRVVGREPGGVKFFYSVINAPLVSMRDYTIRVVDQTDPKDPKGTLKVGWTVANDKGPAEREGVVRVKVNDGTWVLEPLDGGAKTQATYFLFTDPGGSLPVWVINKANSSTIPDIYKALRKFSKEPKYSGP